MKRSLLSLSATLCQPPNGFVTVDPHASRTAPGLRDISNTTPALPAVSPRKPTGARHLQVARQAAPQPGIHAPHVAAVPSLQPPHRDATASPRCACPQSPYARISQPHGASSTRARRSPTRLVEPAHSSSGAPPPRPPVIRAVQEPQPVALLLRPPLRPPSTRHFSADEGPTHHELTAPTRRTPGDHRRTPWSRCEAHRAWLPVKRKLYGGGVQERDPPPPLAAPGSSSSVR